MYLKSADPSDLFTEIEDQPKKKRFTSGLSPEQRMESEGVVQIGGDQPAKKVFGMTFKE